MTSATESSSVDRLEDQTHRSDESAEITQEVENARLPTPPPSPQTNPKTSDTSWTSFVTSLKFFYSSVLCPSNFKRKYGTSGLFTPLTLQKVSLSSGEETLLEVTENYRDILTLFYGDPRLAIISGTCGSGKTTLAKRILKEWCDGELPQFSLVIYVPSALVAARLRLGVNLSRVFIEYLRSCGNFEKQAYPLPETTIFDLIDSHMEWSKSSVLLIADHSVLTKNCRLATANYLRFNALPCHTLLLTTREPSCMQTLCSKAFFVAHLVGFSGERSKAYCVRIAGQKLVDFIANDEDVTDEVRDLMKLPLVATLVCELFVENRKGFHDAFSSGGKADQCLSKIVYNFLQHQLSTFKFAIAALRLSAKPDGRGLNDAHWERLKCIQEVGRYAWELLSFSLRTEVKIDLLENELWAMHLCGIFSLSESGKLFISNSLFLEFLAAVYVASLLQRYSSTTIAEVREVTDNVGTLVRGKVAMIKTQRRRSEPTSSASGLVRQSSTARFYSREIYSRFLALVQNKGILAHFRKDYAYFFTFLNYLAPKAYERLFRDYPVNVRELTSSLRRQSSPFDASSGAHRSYTDDDFEDDFEYKLSD